MCAWGGGQGGFRELPGWGTHGPWGGWSAWREDGIAYPLPVAYPVCFFHPAVLSYSLSQ